MTIPMRTATIANLFLMAALPGLVIASSTAAHAQQVAILPVPAQSLVYNPTTKKLYASVANSPNPGIANSVTIIDPAAARVENSIAMGGDAGVMTLSDQGTYLYVGISDGSRIRRINLQNNTAGIAFPVGDGISAWRLMPVPGAPEAVAAARKRHGQFPDNEGIAVYQNGIASEKRTDPGHQLVQGISPARLFGYENMISSYGFMTINLSKDGAEGAGSSGGVLGGNVGLASSANGLIVTNHGTVIDPEARQKLGDLPGISEPLVAHGQTGLVYSITGKDGRYQLNAANLQSLAAVGSFPFVAQGAQGSPRNLVWCGDDLLAFSTLNATVILKSKLGAKLPNVDLAVTRSALPSSISNGMEFSYTLTVTNAGTAKASSVYLTDTLQSGLEPVAVKALTGDAIASGGIVRAELGSLAAGAKTTVTVKVRVAATDKIGLTAVVRGAEPDPQTANNISIYGGASSLKIADLAIEWSSAEQNTQGAGADIEYALSGVVKVSNKGEKPSKPCLLRFYAGDGPAFVPSLYPIIQEAAIPALAPGQTYNVRLQTRPSFIDFSGTFMYAQVDARNEVEEKTKENNVARTQIK